MPSINWDQLVFTPGGRYKEFSVFMLSLSEGYGLHQMVKKVTRKASILDLCFTNCPDQISDLKIQDGISDHDIVVASILAAASRPRSVKREIYIYKTADFKSISKNLETYWNQVTTQVRQSASVEELWLAFKTSLKSAIDHHIPSKMSSTRFNRPWIDRKIRRDINRERRLYNKAKAGGKGSDWEVFRETRRSMDRKIRRAYWKYISDVIGGSLEEDNPKPF